MLPLIRLEEKLIYDCCPSLASHISDTKVSIYYYERFREYGIGTTSSAKQSIFYCPWCGSKLPSRLRDKWFDEIDAMGIEPDDVENIPTKYLSDLWWKLAH